MENTAKVRPVCAVHNELQDGMEGLEAVRYRTDSASVEITLPPVSYHCLVLISRPPEKLDVRYEGVKGGIPPAAGSIAVVPAGSSQLVRWQGSKEDLLIYLEPTLVARVAAESFGFDSSRTVLPPLYGLNVPELRSAMLAVDAELRAGGVGGSLLVESLANVLAVHLIRHITGPRRLNASADGALPRHKLRRVIEYIMESLGGSPTLKQMAAVVHLSPFHFARQFKAATGLAPHQYVIARRVERAQDLLRTDGGLGLAEVAFRSGFANQSHFCLQFKRIVGGTPRQFRQEFPKRTQLRKGLGSPGPASLLLERDAYQGNRVTSDFKRR
ncbi:MAG TPA: AraC family transcriptional regulator [Terriglobales bacterium]|nr:AraC family transcriptional regulator [Terriglobales bacterium]